MEYIICIDNGCVIIAEEVRDDNGVVSYKDPYAVVTLQYGVREDGTHTMPNDPTSVTTRFDVDMTPFIVPNYLGMPAVFHWNPTGHMVMSLSGEASPIVQQYNHMRSALNSGKVISAE